MNSDYANTTEAAAVPDGLAARPTISNYTLIDGGTSIVPVPKGIDDIVADIHRATGGWPRRVGTILVIDDVGGLRRFDRDRVAGLFAWLRSRFEVDWKVAWGFVSKRELYAQLLRVARSIGGSQ